MTEVGDDCVLIESPLSGEFRRDGIIVEVMIYRGEDEASWVLEVVDQGATSYLWDDQFASDELALKEFMTSVERLSMKQFNPHYKQGTH